MILLSRNKIGNALFSD